MFSRLQAPTTIESFRLEYEYDFRISNQLRSQNRRFSLLLIRDNIGVLFDDVLWVSKVVLVLKSKVP